MLHDGDSTAKAAKHLAEIGNYDVAAPQNQQIFEARFLQLRDRSGIEGSH